MVELLGAMRAHGAAVWLDGGWGIDALLGEQTREHADLDVVLEVTDEPAVIEALRRKGFEPAYRGDTSAWNYAVGDARGREVDLHVFTEGSTGAGWYGPPDAQVSVFTPWARGGRGSVAGHAVRTIRAEVLVGFHTGYPVDENDWHDVRLLAERISLTIPPDYDRYRPDIAPVADRVAVGPGSASPIEVETLLRLLPDWFGVEEALVAYVEASRRMPTVTARDERGTLVGVALLEDHDPGCPEVHLLAVHPAWRRHGLGGRLVRACQDLARDGGHRLLQVKTLGPSHPHRGYAGTREFYAATGFLPVQEHLDLWPGHPALVLVAPL